MKEEMVSNLTAKRDDLMAQGMDAERAAEKAMENLPDVDFLMDGNQLTDVSKYRLECMQAVLLNCVIFWVFSFPLLFTGYASVCYAGLTLVILSGCIYLAAKCKPADADAFLSVTASKRRRKMAWIISGPVLFRGSRNYGGADLRKQYLVRPASEYQWSVSDGKHRSAVLPAPADDFHPCHIQQFYKDPAEQQKGRRK